MEVTRTRSLTSQRGGGKVESVGATSWSSGTKSAVQECSDLVRLANRNVDVARTRDPLPGLREVVAGLSNDQAHAHFRRTRPVVYSLRDTTINLNSELRALVRLRDALHKTQAEVSRNLKVNSETQQMRQRRPAREKAADDADGLVAMEKQHLLQLKKSLETEMDLIQQQLKKLDAARKRLTVVTRERARVLDLVCHDPVNAGSKLHGAQNRDSDGAMGGPDPLGGHTPEVDGALSEAMTAIQSSANLRQAAAKLLAAADDMLKTVMNAVNSGLTRKIAETNDLKHQLQAASEENKLASIKVQKVFDDTEYTWNQLRGPVSSKDLELRERLNRPVIKVMQRHPGNQMPEAQYIVQNTEELMDSLQTTGNTLGRLKLSQLHLQEDARSKNAAIKLDSSVMRMRKHHTAH